MSLCSCYGEFRRTRKYGSFTATLVVSYGLWKFVTKGQVISKCPFGVFKSPKKTSKIL